MARIPINISTPNDGLGDPLRDAFNYQNQMNTELYESKVDKVTGKVLSSNDYTTTEKNKLANIEENAQVNVQADWLQSDNTEPDYIKNKPGDEVRIFRALASQLGVSAINDIDDGPVEIGVSYTILAYGGDFSNVGAPNNNLGTSFIALNSNTPTYGISSLRYDSGAPKLIILKNTIGNVWCTYFGVGTYALESVNKFADSQRAKLTSGIGYGDQADGIYDIVADYSSTDDDNFYFKTFARTYDTYQNGILNNDLIEITIW